MFNKLYEEIKKTIKENFKSIIVFLIILLVCLIEFPCYIEAPGGIIKVDDRINIDYSYESQGSFNLAYVSEIKATIPTLFFSLINKDWNVVKVKELTYENESIEDAKYRSKLLLNEANNNAIIVAYTKANQKIDISNEHLYIIYVLEKAETDLKIGDEILAIDGINIINKSQLDKIMNDKEVGSKVAIKAKRKEKEITCHGVVKLENNKKIIGLALSKTSDIETDPKIDLKFKKQESGPSGGLTLALSIYNNLVSEDITKGKKIVGTGTIDLDGNIGSIGGVKYKIKGAAKEKADLFLVPAGENYEEAKKVVEENNYKLKLIPVTTFDDAINKLKNL